VIRTKEVKGEVVEVRPLPQGQYRWAIGRILRAPGPYAYLYQLVYFKKG